MSMLEFSEDGNSSGYWTKDIPFRFLRANCCNSSYYVRFNPEYNRRNLTTTMPLIRNVDRCPYCRKEVAVFFGENNTFWIDSIERL
jgi:hypothetical protein